MRVLTPEEFKGLPYIVANEEARLTATYSDQTYARGLDGQVGEEFVVARLTNIYDRIGKPPEIRRVLPKEHWKQVPNVWDRHESLHNPVSPWNRRPEDPVGYELLEVSRVRVAKAGEISVLDIVRDRTEVKPGDYILPANDPGYESVFYPSAMDSIPTGLRVLATAGQRSGAGPYQIVAISGGANQGLEPGHVFSAFHRGKVVDDRTGYRYGSFAKDAEVELPAMFDGHIMVFRTFAEVSYAMVMSATGTVREFDTLRHPDETL
jgi:hypothetical protein